MLSALDGGVSEKLFQLGEVIGAIEELDGEGVTEGMRVNIHIQRLPTDVVDDAPDRSV